MEQDEAQIQLIDHRTIANLAQQAADSPRKRSHLLLHAGHADQVQRLVIVLQPGSYVRPHHHSQQWEMLVALQGRGYLHRFSETGRLLDRFEMSSSSKVAQIQIGEFHGFLVLDPDTVILEIKPGPYRPNEFAEWAPPEGHASAPMFIGWLASAEIGNAWRSNR
jgi:cupin fold WbuC family metalloprotein